MTTDHAPGARSTSAVSYHKRQHGSSKTHPLRFCRQQPACTTAPGARRTKDEVPDTADLGCPSSHEIGKLKLGVVFARHRKLDHLRRLLFWIIKSYCRARTTSRMPLVGSGRLLCKTLSPRHDRLGATSALTSSQEAPKLKSRACESPFFMSFFCDSNRSGRSGSSMKNVAT